ncbi:protein kinase domain-containing protein [Tundrisphaera lichenicola]|uniref:protein kinase domain-containing protein n=1 Tax=Tundrisphaera lichenicola TaxID=2029860 RepID=UPI003EBDB894
MPTDPNRVKDIFLEAAARPDETARVAYLERACGGDAALRDRVEVLLRSHDASGSFLGSPAAASADLETMAFASSSTGEDQHITLPDEDCEGLHFLMPSTRPDSLGRIGHYEVLEVLGRGGFGIVFRAFDEVLHRVVAIKVLAPQMAATSPARKRFLREARSSAKVRHENVVQVYAVEELPLPYLAMEFIPGETLQQRLDRTGPLETAEVLKIGRQIAEGLAAAHDEGLIHRDIKPGNILIEAGPNQHVKITDFGLARAADDASMTQSGVVAGTPMYMAPEQAYGDKLDHRADLFSLGSVLYTMCSGRPPFRANSTLAVLKRVTEDTPRPIRDIIPEVPQWVCDIISRLQAKNPDDRIATAREVADLLARGLAASPRPGSLASVPEVRPVGIEKKAVESEALEPTVQLAIPGRAIRMRSRKRLWAATAALLLITLASFGFTEATGVTDFHGTVIRLLSAEGTLVVEVDDPGVSVKIDGSDIVITGAGVRELRMKPGSHSIEARKDGKVVSQELVTVAKNGRQVVRVSREGSPSVAKTLPHARPSPRSVDESAWERIVAALSAAEQVKAVRARLKELNPGFDGAVAPTIEKGVVRGLEFNADDVSDISPLRVLTKLRTLNCSGTGDRQGLLTDLSPLSGLPLTSLNVSKSQLVDLSPLRGMPLTEFMCYGTLVDDLSPLEGMKLRVLNFVGTKVYDLSPLNGMPLENLDLGGTNVGDLTGLAGMRLRELSLEGTKISDLSPVKRMPLTSINLSGTPVSDLSPLKGMELNFIHLGGTQVSDLSPLNGMPLTHLNCDGSKVDDGSLSQIKGCKDLNLLILDNTQVSDDGLLHLKDLRKLKRLNLVNTKVSDLSPLTDLSLEEIRLNPTSISPKGLDSLRDMKSLKTIGTDWNQAWPAGEFWARYDKGEFK